MEMDPWRERSVFAKIERGGRNYDRARGGGSAVGEANKKLDSEFRSIIYLRKGRFEDQLVGGRGGMPEMM